MTNKTLIAAERETLKNLMISEATKLYLTKKEWSMGNGQCYECCGMGPNWGKGMANEPLPEETGHKRSCKFAKMLKELGFDVLYAKKGR